MTTDKEILTAVRANPETGFRLLLASYMQPVYWHVRRMVVSHDDAQDVAQETFVRVFTKFAQYSGKSSLKAWIFKIATNEALRHLGKERGATTLSLDDVTAEMLSLKADEYYDDSDAIAARLQKAILSLPAKQQMAFNLRYYDEMGYDDIAEVTGSTAAAAKVNYHLAKERIIEFMNSND